MFASPCASIKLHLLFVVVLVGVSYFMYQLYNECKELEKELLIAKKQIAILTSQEMLKEIDASIAPQEKKDDKKEDKEHEEIDIDDAEDDVSVKSEYIANVVANVQQAEEDVDSDTDDVVKEEESQPDEPVIADEEIIPSITKTPEIPIVKYSKEKLQRMKIAELMKLCKSLNIYASGTKTEIVSRIVTSQQ